MSVLAAVSEPILLVGLGWACRLPRALPDLLGVLLVDVFVFGDIEMGECGECECVISVGVAGCNSDGLSDNPTVA